MKRLHGRSTERTRWTALCLALFLLLQAAPISALAATGDEESGAPSSSKAAREDALVESLFEYFFGPQQQSSSAAQAQPSPSPTPAQAANAQASPTPAAKGEEKPLQYPLPDWTPLGHAGRKTVKSQDPASEEFIPMPDRWRFPFPRYQRYNPSMKTPWVTGRTFDPYNQNVLKADYPVFGNHTFLNLNLQSVSFLNPRVVANNGRHEQFFTNQNFVMGLELFKGDAAFEPKRWAFRVTTVANVNFLANNTLDLFKSKPGFGRLAVEEAFVERRIAVVSPNFDFISIRAGMQNFNSDFRGFLFQDNQLGVRLFGSLNANRDEFNVAYFSMRQRDIVSQLHSFDRRFQNVFLVNWFRQDFGTKGYTALFNFVFNNDNGRFVGDKHTLNVAYLGFHGDGKWGKLNVDHAFYWALGHDAFNLRALRPQTINAQMGSFEAAIDRDWIRWRGTFFYASGDGNLNDNKATGFDMIQDNPNIAGGPFQFWTQQQSNVAGLGFLKNKFSLLPDLRDKFDNRANFVNPGLLMLNVGADMRLTPKLKMVTNLAYIRFARARVLQQLTGNPNITGGVGTDASFAFKYRPFENENLFIVAGTAILFPQGGYGRLVQSTKPLVSPTFAFQVAF